MNTDLKHVILFIIFISMLVCIYGIVLHILENRKIDKVIKYFKERSAKKESNDKYKECLKIIKENQEKIIKENQERKNSNGR